LAQIITNKTKQLAPAIKTKHPNQFYQLKPNTYNQLFQQQHYMHPNALNPTSTNIFCLHLQQKQRLEVTEQTNPTRVQISKH